MPRVDDARLPLAGADIRPLGPSEADTLLSWTYPPPYDLYNMVADNAARAEALDPDSPYFGVFDRAELLGFFCFGPPARVGAPPPAHVYVPGPLDIGLGLRPELTGRGWGLPFLRAGLAFARARFNPPSFRLSVATFNRRAITVYERTGFRAVTILTAQTPHGVHEFLVMATEQTARTATMARGME